MKTYILNNSDIETTWSPIIAAEDGSVLTFGVANKSQEKALSLQTIEFGEIRYQRKSDWMRLVNKLNSYDATPLKNELTGSKKSSDWGLLKISREDIEYSEDGFLIEFKEPVKLKIADAADKAVIVEASKLRGKITWEWSFYGNCAELDNYANVCEIFIYDIEILS